MRYAGRFSCLNQASIVLRARFENFRIIFSWFRPEMRIFANFGWQVIRGKISLMKYSQPDKTNMLKRVQLLRFHVKMFCLVLRSYGFLRASDIVFYINFNLSSGEYFLMCSESISRRNFNAHLLSARARGLQRDVVCLDRPIPHTYSAPGGYKEMSSVLTDQYRPRMRAQMWRVGWGGGCGVLANEYICAHGTQINFGDITPYLT